MVISMLIRKVGRLNWKAYITRDQLCGLSLGLHLSQGAGFHQICLMFARCLFDVCSMFVRSCIRVYRQTNKQINKNRQKHYLLGGDNYYSNGGGFEETYHDACGGVLQGANPVCRADAVSRPAFLRLRLSHHHLLQKMVHIQGTPKTSQLAFARTASNRRPIWWFLALR